MTFDVKKLTRSSILLALAIVFQTLGRAYPVASQFVVGSVINSIFILCLLMNGLSWSILIAMLTPILAWTLGQLPQPLGPIVPVIALGNIVFIITFNIIIKKFRNNIKVNFLGILAASLLKFLAIFIGTKLVLNLVQLPSKAQTAAAKLMGINQFITAMIGGFAAILLIEVLFSRKQLNPR